MTSGGATVTILFTDLVGSTELLQRAGDEQAQRIFKAHHRLLRDAAEQHGGQEVKWLGDGLMVALPSAADAVRCAIAMQNAARRPAAGERLEIRVGLHIGDAFRDESDYFGTPVVIARRLCDKAGAGQIYASDLVVRLVSGRREFNFRDMGPLMLKGIADAVPAAEVLYEHDPLAMLTRTPFVGRAEEMAALQRALEEARAGRGSLVMLVGEPGIGKTRTAEEFCDLARDSGALVLWGRCYEGEWAAPFSPFAEAIRAYASTVDDDALRAALGKDAGTLARVVPDLAERLPDLPEPASLPAEGERYRLLEAVSSFFGSAADGHALVIVLDDLHWSDRSTAAMLRHTAREFKAKRIMVLGTYRDVEVGQEHPLAAALGEVRRETTLTRIGLGGLAAPEVEQFLDVIAEQAVASDLVEAIAAESGGNPFFIREMLAHLIEEGKVVEEDGRWASALPIAEMSIPEGVRDVIGRRLSRLSEPSRRMLTVASAMAGGFTWAEMRAVAGEPESTLLDALDEALGAQLLNETRPSTYEFPHALIRHTLYDALTTPRRAALHRDIGGALEALYQGDIPSHLSELAHHFYLAGGDAKKATEYCRGAADLGMERLAFDEAALNYERAAALLGSSTHVDLLARAELLLSRANAIFWAGRDDDSLDAYIQAADSARLAGRADLFARGDSRLQPVRHPSGTMAVPAPRGAGYVAATR